MSASLNPDATYDCLVVGDRLGRSGGAFAPAELHLFAYLACLLWLYREHAVSDWGYSFVGTELGAPFSIDVDASIRELIEGGYLVRHQEKLRVSSAAAELLREFAGLALNEDRTECLHAACSSTSAFSVGMVGTAMAQEPELRRARALPASRPLLEEAALSQLHEQFEALRLNLDQGHVDLRVPAVVWLAALYRSNQSAGG